MSNINLGQKVSAEDAAGLKKEAEQKEQRERTRDEMKALKEALKKAEAQDAPGASSNLPKSDVLDARALEKQNPDKHYRYLNTANTERMPGRIHREKYTPVPEAEAEAVSVNARVGRLMLAEQPREIFEKRVAAQEAEHQRRLRSHKQSMEQVVESVAKQLRDKHGIEVDTKRLLVDE